MLPIGSFLELSKAEDCDTLYMAEHSLLGNSAAQSQLKLTVLFCSSISMRVAQGLFLLDYASYWCHLAIPLQVPKYLCFLAVCNFACSFKNGRYLVVESGGKL